MMRRGMVQWVAIRLLAEAALLPVVFVPVAASGSPPALEARTTRPAAEPAGALPSPVPARVEAPADAGRAFRDAGRRVGGVPVWMLAAVAAGLVALAGGLALWRGAKA